MRLIIGIDPGKHGAIASIDIETRELKYVDMPLHEGDLDLLEMTRHVEWWTNSAELIVIEKLHALPQNMGGSIANFQRGYAMGVLRMSGSMAMVDVRLVAPQTWQKEMLIEFEEGTTKERSVRAANSLFKLSLKKTQDGVADAALIAEYGRRRWAQGGDR